MRAHGCGHHGTRLISACADMLVSSVKVVAGGCRESEQDERLICYSRLRFHYLICCLMRCGGAEGPGSENVVHFELLCNKRGSW